MTRPHLYILKDHIPVPVEDVLVWGRWIEEAYTTREKIVQQDQITPEIRISTVFLGIDHGYSWMPDAIPILFETMVFGGPFDGEINRYSNWVGAEAGHAKIVQKVKDALSTE